jgi:ketosteroid isomerase-like protein
MERSQGARGGTVNHTAEVAWSYWALISQGKIPEALAQLDDEGTFWLNRTRQAVPMSSMKAVVGELLARMPGITFTLHGVLVDGNRVALEFESHATLPDGTPYNNVYCVIVTVRGDAILHVREYGDTRHGEQATNTAQLMQFIETATRGE